MDPAQASVKKLGESGIRGIRVTVYDEPIIDRCGRFGCNHIILCA